MSGLKRAGDIELGVTCESFLHQILMEGGMKRNHNFSVGWIFDASAGLGLTALVPF
jgi:hypothetical protein